MVGNSQSDSAHRGDQPGKTRTMWHPLLVRLLAVTLDSAYRVEEEVNVGKMPLRVDILLIRREGGKLPDAKARDIQELLPLLNSFTLLEFKAPTDVIESGDLARLIGCAYLWHGQQSERVSHADLSLMVLAPSVTAAFREDLRCLGFGISPHNAEGIFRVTGSPFATWVVETDAMAEQAQPILSLVSRAFLSDRRSIIEKLAAQGGTAMAHIRYMVQQVVQFSKEEGIAMEQVLAENLEEFDRELLTKQLQAVPPEQRLRDLSPEERVRGLPPEERLRGLPPEEVLRVLSAQGTLTAEQLLAGLNEENAARLLELLLQKRDENGGK